MAKIDWLAAELEYTNNIALSYVDIARKYGVSVTSVENWAAKRKWGNRRKKALAKLAEKLGEKTANTIAEHQARLMTQAQYIAGEGLKGMIIHKPLSAREAKEMWEAATNLQLKVLGLDKPQGSGNTYIQNNNFIGWDQVIAELERRKEAQDGSNQI